MLVSFPLAFIVIRSIKETNYEDEKVVYVSDVKNGELEHGQETRSATGSAEKEKEEHEQVAA